VTIAQGQFLTVPFLPFQSSNFAKTFTVAAWIRISDLPAEETTIFSTHSADGSETGIKFVVNRITKQIKAYAIGQTIYEIFPNNPDLSVPEVQLSTWHLIGFTFTSKSDEALQFYANLFVDNSQFHGHNYELSGGSFDMSTIKILRVGGAADSFVGDVTALRVMNPGAPYLPETACSASNAIELGSESFALTCPEGSSLSTSNSKCYETCPTDTELSTGTPISLCMKLPVESIDIIESDGGLSGGAIAGIAIGCVALLLLILLVTALVDRKRKLNQQQQKYKDPKQDFVQVVSSPNTPMTNTEMAALKA